jgi:hypothetical protein
MRGNVIISGTIGFDIGDEIRMGLDETCPTYEVMSAANDREWFARRVRGWDTGGTSQP